MPLQKAACWQPPATTVSRNMLQPDALGACGRLLRRDMCCWPFDFRQAACSKAVLSMHCCNSVHTQRVQGYGADLGAVLPNN